MAKNLRSRLARGAKLLTGHIFSPLSAVQAKFFGADVDIDQVDAKYAPFRMNFSIPRLDFASCANYGEGYSTTDAGPHYGIPFWLPPLQGDLAAVLSDNPRLQRWIGSPSDSIPEILLDEVVVSFDQRLEGAAIISNWDTDGAAAANAQPDQADGGKISYERADRLNINVAILEKLPSWAPGYTVDPAYFSPLPGRPVWTGRINNVDVSSGHIRLNPWVSSDIGAAIDPYKSYVLIIDAPNLSKNTVNYADGCTLVSLEVSLKFISRLTTRDTEVANIPLRHEGIANDLSTPATWPTGAGKRSQTARSAIGTVPATGATIVANDSGTTTLGVQTVMSVIDEFHRRKLQGGYKLDSDLPTVEELKNTAGYTVLTVPLFNNGMWGGLYGKDWDEEPYCDGTGPPWPAAIDRRYIPIEAPMTIHHVLFTYPWYQFATLGSTAAQRTTVFEKAKIGGLVSGSLEFELGVGIGTGVRTEAYGYESIAYKKLISPNSGGWKNEAIDRMQIGRPSQEPNAELHFAPIGGTSGTGSPSMGNPTGTGTRSQNAPVFVGRGTSATGVRQAMPGAVYAKTHGQEQWIEVRGRLHDTARNPTGYDANSMAMGAGGVWVYIIGKTHLV